MNKKKKIIVCTATLCGIVLGSASLVALPLIGGTAVITSSGTTALTFTKTFGLICAKVFSKNSIIIGLKSSVAAVGGAIAGGSVAAVATRSRLET